MSRKYLDEFLAERSTAREHRILKPSHQFGDEAGKFIVQVVREQYSRHANTLRHGISNDPQACANQFFEDRYSSLVTLMYGFEDPEDSDDEFESRIRFLVGRWFRTIDLSPEFSKVRETLRHRMSRDKLRRFTKVNVGWALVDGPKEPTTVMEIQLKIIARQYPLEVNLSKANSPDSQRMVNYGKRGQLEELLFHVIEAADGAVSLSMLARIVLFCTPQIRTLENMEQADSDSIDQHDDAVLLDRAPSSPQRASLDEKVHDRIEHSISEAPGRRKDPDWVRHVLKDIWPDAQLPDTNDYDALYQAVTHGSSANKYEQQHTNKKKEGKK